MTVNILITLYVTLANGLVFVKRNSLNLDFLFKKSLQYQYDEANYEEPLVQNIVSFALRINKLQDIQPLSKNFSNLWSTILYNTLKLLVYLLLTEKHFCGWFERKIFVEF